MDYDPSIICDYVTLFIKDADNHPESKMVDGKCCWNIPYNAYYFKDRGNVCLMSVVDANLSKNVSDCAIYTQRGFNGICSDIDQTQFANDIQDLAMLGSFSHTFTNNTNYVTEYQTHQQIKLLTPARPTQIQLYFYNDKRGAIGFTSGGANNDLGHVTIKFEYVNPAELEKNIVKQEYGVAF